MCTCDIMIQLVFLTYLTMLPISFLLQIESELTDICDDILSLLSDFLIPSAKQPESKVFYHKM